MCRNILTSRFYLAWLLKFPYATAVTEYTSIPHRGKNILTADLIMHEQSQYMFALSFSLFTLVLGYKLPLIAPKHVEHSLFNEIIPYKI